MSKLPEEYYVKAKEYSEMFGVSFPSLYFYDLITDDEMVKIIGKCIDAGKDAYEMGYAKLPEDDEDF